MNKLYLFMIVLPLNLFGGYDDNTSDGKHLTMLLDVKLRTNRETYNLDRAVRNNANAHTIIPESTLRSHYRHLIEGLSVESYGLIYNKIEQEFLARKKDHDVLPYSYWEDLTKRLVTLYAETEVGDDQEFTFLKN